MPGVTVGTVETATSAGSPGSGAFPSSRVSMARSMTANSRSSGGSTKGTHTATRHPVWPTRTPVRFQKFACICDLRRSAIHAAGMIKTVALRLLYLIFDRFLHRLMLLGRPSSSKDVELVGARNSAHGR
jgi:hypothetical protein